MAESKWLQKKQEEKEAIRRIVKVEVDAFAENVPKALQDISQWVTWKFVQESNDKKPKKVPINPDSGKKASTKDPKSWATFQKAINGYWWDKVNGKGVDGIGFVLTRPRRITFIDLDNCRDDNTGDITEWAQGVIKCFDSYTEISPSGTGVHILVHGLMPKGEDGRRRDTPGRRVEMYCHGRYATITGKQLAGTPSSIEDREQQVRDFFIETFGRPKNEIKSDISAKPHIHVAQAQTTISVATDDEIVSKLHAEKNNEKFARLWEGIIEPYPSASEADAALASKIAFYTQNPEQVKRIMVKSGLSRDKWKRDDYLTRTAEFAIKKLTDHGAKSDVKQDKLHNLVDSNRTPQEVKETNDEELSEVSQYDTDITFIERFLRHMGSIEPFAPGARFYSPLQPRDEQEGPTCTFYPDRKGRFKFRDFSIQAELYFTTAQVYCSFVSGVRITDLYKMSPPEMGLWKVRLLIEMGLRTKPDIEVPPLPSGNNVPTSAREAYESFKYLLEVREVHSGEATPTPFSYSFLERWRPTTERKARSGINWLIKNHQLICVRKDTDSNLNMYEPNWSGTSRNRIEGNDIRNIVTDL